MRIRLMYCLSCGSGRLLFFALVSFVSVLSAQGASAQTADIVLYASDVTTIRGNWARLSSTTGAGGQKMTSADRGWSSPDAPPLNPADYFEATFDASAGVPYRLWLRLRAAANSKLNESVWVQFQDAVTSAGAPLWPIDSASALLVNLENCSGCGVAEWGWQDNAYWLNTSSVVRFRNAGPQRIRILTREDGVDVDQIVLSPSTFFSAAPGSLKNDSTIVSKSAAPSPGITLVRAPYLQQATATSAVVVWTTREGGAADVRFTQAGGTTRTTVGAQSRLFSAATTGLPYDFYQHEAHLAGLAPRTTYTYDVYVGGIDATASTDSLTTAPADGVGTVRFIAFGDSGTGSTAQRQLASRMSAGAFDLAIHAGDVAYGNSGGTGGGSYRQYDDWVFSVYAAWLRSRPFFPSIGNHDNEVLSARPYRDVFVLPGNGASPAWPDHAERFYSFDYGSIHFIALDTELAFQNTTRRQAQIEWLIADLSATSQPWRVVYMHRPPYSAGSHHGSDAAVRAAFAPIFEQFGVQVVFTGHEHVYERTTPWREHRADGSPVTYIVTGGGGGPLYPAGLAPWTAFSRSAHHFVRVLTGNCLMTIEAVGIDGVVFDRFNLDRCAQQTDASVPETQITAPAESATVSGTIAVEAFAQDDVGIVKTDLIVDGVLRSVDSSAPYSWTVDTRTLADGTHTLQTRAYDVAGRRASSRVVSMTVANAAAPPPVKAVPGQIEAEDFDAGPNGTAYRDVDAGNRGGQYRATDVDLERSSEAGYNVGWIAAGEWLNFTVNVAAAGTYTLEARVASATSGGTFHVEFGGVNKTGPMAVPATGGWQTWRTVTRTVTLAAGTQVMRLTFDTPGYNVNYVRLIAGGTSTPFGGTPRAVPGTVQAEDFDDGGEAVAYHDATTTNSGGQYRATGVDLERTGDTSGAYNVGWLGAGEWLKYTVNVAATGVYTLTVRVASPGTGGRFHVEAGGVDVSGPIQVPATGAWQTYQSVSVPITLNGGVHVLRFVMDANGTSGAVGNVNFFTVR